MELFGKPFIPAHRAGYSGFYFINNIIEQMSLKTIDTPIEAIFYNENEMLATQIKNRINTLK